MPRPRWLGSCGKRACAPRRHRSAIPKRCCKSGRRRAACQRRSIARSPAPGHTTIRNFASRCSFRNLRLPKARGGPSARRRRLDRAMVDGAWAGTRDADLAALVIDASKGVEADDEAIVKALANVPVAKTLVLNKIDLVAKPKLLDLAQALNDQAAFAASFMISARSADGVAELKSFLAAHLPVGPWLYPADQISDAPMRQFAAEITREKLYLRLHQALPYRSTVETESWKELKDGSVRIEQIIYVERESQRKIVLGKGGQTIKAIGAAARTDIAAALDHPVHLFFFVKVREGWADDPERYREMGLEFPKG